MSAKLKRCFCRGPGGIVYNLVYILCVCEVQVLFIDQIKLSFVKAQKMASKKKLVLQKKSRFAESSNSEKERQTETSMGVTRLV